MGVVNPSAGDDRGRDPPLRALTRHPRSLRAFTAFRAGRTGRSSSAPAGSDRAHVTLAGIAALLTFVLWDWFFRPVGGGRDTVGFLIGRDFLPVWAAPRIAMAHGVAMLTDIPAFAAALPDLVGVQRVFAVWSYPPTALILFMPFSLASYWTSLALWTVAGWVAYLGSVAMLRGRRPRAPALLLLATSPAMWLNSGTGQNGAFTAALLVGGMAMLGRRPCLAGLMFGLMTVKPQIGLALAVALVAIRAWRAVAAALATAAALAGGATALFGPGAWQGYEAVAMPYSIRILAAPSGGQKLLLVSLTSALTQAGMSVSIAMVLQAAAAVLVLATLWAAARRTGDPLRLLTLVAAATPLVSPYLWAYDLVALGAALALRFVDDPGTCPRWILAMGFLAPALSMSFEILPGIATAPALLALVFAALSLESLKASGLENDRRGPVV